DTRRVDVADLTGQAEIAGTSPTSSPTPPHPTQQGPGHRRLLPASWDPRENGVVEFHPDFLSGVLRVRFVFSSGCIETAELQSRVDGRPCFVVKA
ncbi:hypothetical protein BHM03_00033319, partial [Ensete ventricosum]